MKLAFLESGGERAVARQVWLELVRCDMTRTQEGRGVVELRPLASS